MNTFANTDLVIADMNKTAAEIGGDDANITYAETEKEIVGIPGEFSKTGFAGDNWTRAKTMIDQAGEVRFSYDKVEVGKRVTQAYTRNEKGVWVMSIINPRALRLVSL